MASDAKVGSLASLLTTVKTSLQAALNEVYTRLAGISNADGTLKDGAVSSSAKMGTGVVAATNIAADAVTTAKIADANVTADKLAAAVAGNGLSGGAGSALAVNVDGSTIEIDTDVLRVKAAGIGASHLAAAIAGNGLSGGAGSALAVNVDDSTVEISADTVRVKDGGITNAKLASDAKVGSLAALLTTAKTSLQAAINEVYTSVAGLLGGVSVTAQTLKQWTEAAAYELTAITYSTTYPDVVSTATVKWPDGSAGTFTATTINTTFIAIDAYTISHTVSGKTVTQTAVTRNSAGRVTAKPALTVA